MEILTKKLTIESHTAGLAWIGQNGGIVFILLDDGNYLELTIDEIHDIYIAKIRKKLPRPHEMSLFPFNGEITFKI